MKKAIFAAILLGVFAVSALGEGNRWYSDFWSQKVVAGAQVTVTPPWETYRYDIVFGSGNAFTDSLSVTFTFADGDTHMVRIGGSETCAGRFVIPFYGPKVTSARVKLHGDNWCTLMFWK